MRIEVNIDGRFANVRVSRCCDVDGGGGNAAQAGPRLKGMMTGNGELILVVDDMDIQREIANEMLTLLHYRVSTAASGEEAVAFLRKQKPALVILDMIMPGIDGLDTFRRIKNLHPEQRTIIVSGYSESERIHEALNLGAGAFLRKPFTITELARIVRVELDRPRDGHRYR